jgi:hypothetical protein
MDIAAALPGRRMALVLAMLLAWAPSGGSVSAQTMCSSPEDCPARIMDGGFQQELTAAGINALLGGATVAVTRMIRGESAWGGFLTGLAGGGAVYLGKRVAVEEFGGAGFLGREIASVGGSVIRNASAGRTPFDEVVLPLGPARLYVSGAGIVPRLDLATVAVTGAFMVTHDARLDFAESLSSGAVILRGNAPTPGLSAAGVILTWPDLPQSEGPRLMAHERVHIVQYDQAFLSWAEPAERWILGSASSGILEHIDLGGLALGVRTGLDLTFDYASRPWEQEAYLLSQLVHPAPAHLR